MNIASIYKDTPTSQNIYNEILPYYVSPANSTSNAYLKYLFGRKSDTETSIYSIKPAPNQGALQAVKSDPAVLEARITIATRNDGHTSLRRRNDDTQLVRSKGTETPALPTSFEELISKQQAALLSLTSQQVELLMKYVDTLRRQRTSHQINLECAFCKNNGESLSWYTSHALKTWRGRVQCPVLRAYRCPRCGATGDRAHTIKYCPANMDSDFWSRTNSP